MYIAYFKAKDEKAKRVFILSMAHSFTALFLLYIVHAILSIAGLSDSFMYGIDIHPAALCVIVLGVALAVNTRRLGRGQLNENPMANKTTPQKGQIR